MGTGTSYLTIGEALAVLSVALLVPQLMKPIFAFRLAARSIHLLDIYILLLIGTAFALINPIATEYNWSNSQLPQLLMDPIFWEVTGGVFFLLALGLVIFGCFRSARIDLSTPEPFIIAAAELLAHAEERDRVDFAKDLSKNFVDLVALSSSSGAFTMGDKTRYAQAFQSDTQQAIAFLTLLADPIFCETLVSKCPWDTARMLRSISERKLVSAESRRFVEQIGLQALTSERSMVHREVDYYSGFKAAPVLTNALFRDEHLLFNYHPLAGTILTGSELANAKSLNSFCVAVRSAFSIALKRADYGSFGDSFKLFQTYRSIVMTLRSEQKDNKFDWSAALTLGMELQSLIEDFRTRRAELDYNKKSALYVELSQKNPKLDLVEALARIIEAFYDGILNSFEGPDDPFWDSSLSVFHAVFPSHDQPVGMDPLQQRVAMKFMKKVDKNMDGLYPAYTSVLLLILGPIDPEQTQNPKCAYVVFRNAFYERLRRFPDLVKRDEDRAGSFLSSWNGFDPHTNEIVHIYRGGEKRTTRLDGPNLDPISFDKSDIEQGFRGAS